MFQKSLCRSITFLIAVIAFFVGCASDGVAGTTRDHRGPNGAPEGGVTVNGQKATVTTPPELGGPKLKGGFDTLNATVRDHRRPPKPKDPKP
jgi:hypothetical protein